MPRRIPAEEMDWSSFDDHRRIRVVGHEYHQPALLAASESLIERDGDRCGTMAVLMREPSNAHDPLPFRWSLTETGSATSKGLGHQAHLQIPYSSELLEGIKNTKRS